MFTVPHYTFVILMYAALRNEAAARTVYVITDHKLQLPTHETSQLKLLTIIRKSEYVHIISDSSPMLSAQGWRRGLCLHIPIVGIKSVTVSAVVV